MVLRGEKVNRTDFRLEPLSYNLGFSDVRMNPSVAIPAGESALPVPQRSPARTPSVHRASGLLVITLLWLGIYVAGMFSPALLDDADSVHAEAAREMHRAP